MDKSTLSNYGWVVCVILVLAIMISLATPFGTVIKNGVAKTVEDFKGDAENVLDNMGGATSFDDLGGGGSGGAGGGEHGDSPSVDVVNTAVSQNVLGKYELNSGKVGADGQIAADNTSSYIRVPVQEGERWCVQLGSGWALSVLPVRFEDDAQGLVSYSTISATPEYYIDPDYSHPGAVVEVPANASYMCITLKNASAYDYTENAIIANLSNVIEMTTIGDSITAYNYAANKNWTKHAMEGVGAINTNLGVSGWGYCSPEGTYKDKLSSIPTNSELIVFFGSFNDLSSGAAAIGSSTDVYIEGGSNTLGAYMNYCYDYVLTNHPDAKIAVVGPAPWSWHKPGDEDAEQYVSVMKEICEAKGIPFLDLFHTSGMTPWDDVYKNQYYNDADGVHPNDEGHIILASKITPFLRGVINN